MWLTFRSLGSSNTGLTVSLLDGIPRAVTAWVLWQAKQLGNAPGPCVNDSMAVLEQPDVLAAPRAQADPQQPNWQRLLENGQVPEGAASPAAQAAPEKPSPSFRLHLYGLYPVSEQNPAESGRLDYVKEVTDPAGITPNWQPIDGGFAYQTADGKVKMLLGARPAK